MIIYMEQTLALIAAQNTEAFKNLVKQGEVAETEAGQKYLVIKDK